MLGGSYGTQERQISQRQMKASLLICVALLNACGGGSDSGPSNKTPTTTTSVTPSDTAAYWGYTSQFLASDSTNTGTVIWASSDTNIATVTQSGLVMHISPGTTQISAQINGINGSAKATTLGFKPDSLSVQNEDNCTLSEDGQAMWCWGNGYPLYRNRTDAQQLTYPNALRVDLGSEVTAGTQFKQVAPGFPFSCALTTTGRAFCWDGAMYSGETKMMGTGGVLPTAKPHAVLQGALPTNQTFKSIKTGSSHACALATDDNIYCWGRRTALGGTGASFVEEPTKVSATPGKYIDFALGNNYMCALSVNGKPYCGKAFNNLTILPSGELPNNVKLVSLKSHANDFFIGLGDDGWIYSFGGGSGYRYGAGFSTFISDDRAIYRLAQGSIPIGVRALDYSVGGISNSNCLIGDNGKAYCWGRSYQGSAGDGRLEIHENLTPVEIIQGDIPINIKLINIGCGTYHCAAMGNNRLIYAWGFSEGAATGQNSSTAKPISIPKVDMR